MTPAEALHSEFLTTVRYYASSLDELHGAEPSLELGPGGVTGTLTLEGVKGQRATFSWDEGLRWILRVRTHLHDFDLSGTFPDKKFTTDLLRAARAIRELPARRSTDSPIAKYVLSAIPIAALVLLVRVVIITRAEDRSPFESIAITQQILTGFGVDDWFNVALGSLLAAPVASGFLVAILSGLLFLHLTGGLIFQHDSMGWRGGFAMALCMASFLVAMMLAAWWGQVIALVLASIFLYSFYATSPIVDLNTARRAAARFINGSWRGPRFVLQRRDGARPEMSAVDAARFTKTEVSRLLEDLHARRQRALHDQTFSDALDEVVFIGEQLGDVMVADRPRWRQAIRRARLRLKRSLDFHHYNNGPLIVGATVLALTGLVLLNHTPWSPPVCLARDTGDVTAFSLGGEPLAYLVDEERSIVFATDADAPPPEFGPCEE